MKFKLQKPTSKQVKKFALYCVIIVIGNMIAAAGAGFFIVPFGLTMGGTTGIGIFIRNFWDNEFAVSWVVYMFNVALFVLGAIMLGRKFALATLAGTLLYPSFLSLWTVVNEAVQIQNYFNESNRLLAALTGGFLFGLGIGIVVRVGASTGGTDIPAIILHRYLHIPVSIAFWVCDLTIVLLQLICIDIVEVIYGILIMLVSTMIIDKVSPIGMKRTQVQIISRKYKEIRQMILNKLNRGVTMYHCKTGFLQQNTYVLMTIISSRDAVRLQKEVQLIDPEAFMMITNISEVRGRGFSSEKIVLPKSEEKSDDDELQTPELLQNPLPPESPRLP